MYFDYAATTPVHPSVQAIMNSTLAEVFGNASSMHNDGRKARAVVDELHHTVAEYCAVLPSEVIVTGSGTEANNLVIHSTCSNWLNTHNSPGTILTTALEHKAVSEVLEHLQLNGWNIEQIALTKNGQIDVKDLQTKCSEDVALISVQWVNSETGLIQPIEQITELANKHNIPFHCDAMQGFAHLELPSTLPTMMSLAPHKFYGPKGIGALIAKKSQTIRPLVRGGGQEFGLRSGTENTVAYAGFSKAIELLKIEREKRKLEIGNWKLQVLDTLKHNQNFTVTVDQSLTIPGTLHLIHRTLSGEDMCMKADLQNISISTGSACSIGSSEVSSAVKALGYNEAEAKRGIRISFGATTTEDEVQKLIEFLINL